MNYTLLVCKKVVIDKFQNEHFTAKDDILALIESGSFIFDEGNGEVEASALEAVNFKKGKVYDRKVKERLSMYLFRYKTDSPLFPSSKVIFKNTDRIRSTIELLNASESDVHYNDFEYKKNLFSDVITQYKLETPHIIEGITSSDEVVSSSLAFINANIHKKIDLSALADSHFLSYVQFSRRFKNAVGTPPQDYITDMRMKKAKNMLSDTDLSIKEISAECGFANEYYFSGFFRKYQGLSPSEFRSVAKNTDKY